MSIETIADLIEAVRREAEAEAFPIDEPVYRRAGRDPIDPILFGGSLEAPVAIVGRDLGKDEVAAGQPLIGAGGRLVRLGLLAAHGEPVERSRVKDPLALQGALAYALLTNTVPYKPPGNKAYAESVRRRFRPFLARLLADFWRGGHLITLGTEAFQWFEPYGQPDEFSGLGRTDARFDSVFSCQIPAASGSTRKVLVHPLPHPSPLNRRWYSRFPEMLANRLTDILKGP